MDSAQQRGRRKTRVIVCGDADVLATVRKGLRRESVFALKITKTDRAGVERVRAAQEAVVNGGFDVHRARTADECMEMAARLRPRFVFFDACGRTRSATGRVRWMLRAAPGARVAVLVDSMTEAEKGRFIHAGVYDVIDMGAEAAWQRRRIALIAVVVHLTEQERSSAPVDGDDRDMTPMPTPKPRRRSK